MIEQTKGKAHTERLLAYYGGVRNLENMRRLINDIQKLADETGFTEETIKNLRNDSQDVVEAARADGESEACGNRSKTAHELCGRI